MKKKGLLFVVLALMLVATFVFSACGSSKAPNLADAKHSYTLWNSVGDPNAYESYNDNLAVRYLNTLKFEGEDGELVHINLNFTVPAAGSAKDDFNMMISTKNYYDVIDLGQSDYTAARLNELGIVLDLTPYMEECMPNYLAWLEAHPDYARTACSMVNGEKKYYQIYSYHDKVDPWGGWQYRRDWVVKYGKNPDTGASFTSNYDAEKHEWTDDVVFPSYFTSQGASYKANVDPTWTGNDPVFISDWEWMFEIFQTAIADLRSQGKITDQQEAYPFGIFYPGYIDVGDLVTGFNGGGSIWYNNNGTVEFGGTSTSFKTYLECMKNWYSQNWLDNTFAGNSGQSHYLTDSVNVFSGRVGMFYGHESSLYNSLEDKVGKPATEGIYVTAARQPINDIYGDGSEGGQKYVAGVNEFVPTTFYQDDLEFNSIALTKSLVDSGKDIKALLRTIDYLFSEEGCKLTNQGLTKEQYETVKFKNDYFQRYGLTNGSYVELDQVNEDGYKYILDPKLQSDKAAWDAARMDRFTGLFSWFLDENGNSQYDYGLNPERNKVYYEWNFYTSTGYLSGSLLAQLDTEAATLYTDKLSGVRTHYYQNIYKFIDGSVSLDTWDEFCAKAKRSYSIDKVTQNLQDLLDRYK